MNIYDIYNRINNFQEKFVKEEYDKQVTFGFLNNLKSEIYDLILRCEENK
jgi:hypothetical protein